MVKFVNPVENPIYSLIGNETRRKLLQYIACESHYGNQLAQILNLSTPTIHKHLSSLKEGFRRPEDDTPVSILKETRKTKQSFSGYKGGEATYFEISSKFLTMFGVFPNLVYAQNLSPNSPSSYTSTSHSDKLDLFPTEPLKEQYKAIAQINIQIAEKEQELFQLLLEKDELLSEYKKEMTRSGDLLYSERRLLYALACKGLEAFDYLPSYLQLSENIFDALSNIKRKISK
jgi:predicted transcriptional regulator